MGINLNPIHYLNDLIGKPTGVANSAEYQLTHPTGGPSWQAPLQSAATANTKGTQPTAPPPPSPGGIYGPYGASSGAAGPVIDPQQLAIYDQGIGNLQAGINRLPGQLDVGNANIENSYNSAFNDLLLGKSRTTDTYNTDKNRSTQDYRTTKNSILDSGSNQLRSLMRLLGSHGAGGSSDRLVGSGIVQRQQSQQNAGAGQTFGRNNQALDTSFNNYLTDEQKAEGDLGRQRTDQRNTLSASIDQNRASLLQSLASLMGQKTAYQGGNPVGASQPYLDQANTLLGQSDQLGRGAPVYQTAPVNYSAPSLESYTRGPAGAPQLQSASDVEQLSPFLQTLLGKKQSPNSVF